MAIFVGVILYILVRYYMLARRNEYVFGLRSSSTCPAGHSAMEPGAVTRGYLSAFPSTEGSSQFIGQFSRVRSSEAGVEDEEGGC